MSGTLSDGYYYDQVSYDGYNWVAYGVAGWRPWYDEGWYRLAPASTSIIGDTNYRDNALVGAQMSYV